MIFQHCMKVNFKNLLAEASQNFTDPSAWLKKKKKLNVLKHYAFIEHFLLSLSDK